MSWRRTSELRAVAGRGVDQRHVAEGLRKVAEELSASTISESSPTRCRLGLIRLESAQEAVWFGAEALLNDLHGLQHPLVVGVDGAEGR